MQTHSISLWRLRLATFFLAALAAASATHWALKWLGTVAPSPMPLGVSSGASQTDPQAVARFLAGDQVVAKAVPGVPVVSASSRFKLLGVVAAPSGRGYALISVDGKPARPYGVGTQVTDDLVLHSVARRTASLAPSRDGPISMTLELPKLVQTR